ncbi:hypothetical protein MMC24_000082 [Lignoscripta atroalba]|nr:hypothetical protein [Lignoscripta atroalba]
MSDTFSVAAARDRFPALKQSQIFCDNAGGSQVLGDVITSIQRYLSQTNVQLGASYDTSRQSSNLYQKGYAAAARYVNASPDEVVIGSSTTQLFRNLSFALEFQPGDEIILSKLDHETNINPWISMAKRQNLVIKWWTSTNPQNPILDTQTLDSLLSARTKFVACTHTSNVLGTIHAIKAIAQKVHSVPGAFFCVDGVAYAPHRPIDVKELEVDFYAFSWYKVYGPHISMLYARHDIQPNLLSLGHFFNPSETLADKLGVAGSNYELTQAIPIITDYLAQSWPDIAAHEGKLSAILLSYLTADRDDVTVFGDLSPDPAKRVPTISFTVKNRSPKQVVEEVEEKSAFGFRYGHFYSKRLVSEVMGLGEEGVIRVSLVHYNTEDEVRLLVDTLRQVLG